MSKWMPINQPQRATSKRLPDAAWDSRQAGIMARYESGGNHGIKLALEWILDQEDPSFRPTRRQLEKRISFWKERRLQRPGAETTRSNTKDDASPRSPEFDTNAGTVGVAEATTIERRESSRSSSPGFHEVNTRRRSATGSDMTRIATVTPTKACTPDTPDPRCDSATGLSATESATASSSDSPHSDESISCQPSITGTITTISSPMHTDQVAPSAQNGEVKCQLVAVRPKRPRKDPEVRLMHSCTVPVNVDLGLQHEPDATENLRLPLLQTAPSYAQSQKRRLRSTLASIRISITPEQADELSAGNLSRNPFSPGDRRVIEEAAYFFGVSQIDADSFILYYILWVLHADCPVSSERRLHLLKSCAMAASTIEDLDYVLDLLAGEIRSLERLENTQMEVFLLRIVLAFGHKKRRNIGMMKEQLWKATRTFFDLNFFITRLQETANDPQQRIQLDLSSYYAVDFAFRALDDPYDDVASLLSWSMSAELREGFERVRSTNLTLLRNEFMKQWPGTFGLRGEVMQNECLRKWINWCCRTLQARKVLVNPAESLIGAVQDLNTTISHNVAVYWLLWSRWQQERYLPNCGPPWDRDMERMMGISAPELLFELVGMALQCLPVRENRIGISRILRNDSLDWLWRFSEGFLTLKKMSDEQLVNEFLTKLVTDSTTASEARQQQQRMTNEASLRTVMVNTFVRGIENQHAPMESSITLHQRRFSTLTMISRDPTMRSSDTGSTISSLRKHARKFARRSGNPITTSEFGWSQASFGDFSDSMSLMTDLGPLVEVEGTEQ